MNWIRGFRITLASLAVAGLCGSLADAATVRSGTAGMDHWYGRAGGLTGSDSVSEAGARPELGQPLEVGVPANSGSLMFNDVQGVRATPNLRTGEAPVEVGLPANSGSLLFNDVQGIRSKPNLRPYDETDTGQAASSSQLEPPPNQH